MKNPVISGVSSIPKLIEVSQESTCVNILNSLLLQRSEQISFFCIDYQEKELPTVLHLYRQRGYYISITPRISSQIDHMAVSTILTFQTDNFLEYFNNQLLTLDAFLSYEPVLLQDFKMIKAAFIGKGLPIF